MHASNNKSGIDQIVAFAVQLAAATRVDRAISLLHFA
jgi:hypothetical protein